MWNPPVYHPPHVRQRAEWASTPSINEIPPALNSQPPHHQHQRDTSVSSPPPVPIQTHPQNPAPIPPPDAPEAKRLRKKNRDRSERDVDRDAAANDRDRDRDRDRNRDRDRAQTPSVPSIDLQIRQIYAECESAHGKARLLSENVALANPDDVLEDGADADAGGGIIQEFYAECVKAQERIMSQISWATAEAEKSRERELLRLSMIDAGLALPTVPGINGGAINAPRSPSAAAVQGQGKRGTIVTKEEEMLGALLSANQVLTDAIQLRDDWQRAAIAQREERIVEERSRVETRIDRSVSVSQFHYLCLFLLVHQPLSLD